MKRALVAIAAAVLVIAAVLLWSGHASDQAPANPSAAPRTASGFAEPDRAPQLAPSVPPELAAAKAERDAAAAALKASGKTSAAWANDGNLLLEQLAHDSHAAGWEQIGCFAAGCAGTLMYASDDAWTAGRALIEALDGYRAWTGAKQWTSPIRWQGGRVSVTLVLGPPPTR